MTLEDRLVALAGRVAAVVGLEQDWAAQFNGLLTAPQALAAATKAVPGLLRFATDAEALAATYDAAAVTPKQVLALLRANPRRYADLSGLLGAAATAPEGAVAHVGRYAIGSGYHRRSLWQMVNGQWHLVGGMIAIEAADRPTALQVLNAITFGVSSNSTIIFLEPGTQGLVANSYIEHYWDGANWNWRGDNGTGTQRTTTASVGTSDIRLADLPNDMSDVHVHLVAANFDRQERLWCARSPYNAGGTVNVVTSTQINNSPSTGAYGATVYSIQNYGLYARISGTGSPSPVSGRVTVLPGGNN